MFRSISGRYDRANNVLSAGIHHRWRTRAVRWSGAKPGDRVLDCATGTGDLAIAFHKVVAPRSAGSQPAARSVGSQPAPGEVVGTDFVPEMLEIARRKTTAIRFEVADVTRLPFADNEFDNASISFGIRNVNEPARGLAELGRVVRSRGRVMVLEFGQPPNRLVSAGYNWYRSHILPRLGGMLTGKRDAYEYLETSAAAFPCGDEFATMMRSTGAFASVEYQRLSFGIAYLYRGVKM
jgi:demethylmenaquinone methyltransferase / 2-methoxy-6-polyprenyl-1,4-benzoquinol methylase